MKKKIEHCDNLIFIVIIRKIETTNHGHIIARHHHIINTMAQVAMKIHKNHPLQHRRPNQTLQNRSNRTIVHRRQLKKCWTKTTTIHRNWILRAWIEQGKPTISN